MKAYQCCLVWIAILCLSSCQQLIVHPDDKIYFEPEKSHGFKKEDFYFKNSVGNEIHMYEIPAVLKQDEVPKGVIYLLHGNSYNQSRFYIQAAFLIQQGYHFYSIDYRGYGKSEGSPRFPGMFEDTFLGLHKIQQKHPSLPIVIWAQSLGGMMLWDVLDRAEKSETHFNITHALVEGSFLTLSHVARDAMKMKHTWWGTLASWVAPLLIPSAFDPEHYFKKLDKVTPSQKYMVAIMQLHSQKDPLVSFSQGQLLNESIQPECTLFIEEKSHIWISLIEKGKYKKNILQFLKRGHVKGSNQAL